MIIHAYNEDPTEALKDYSKLCFMETDTAINHTNKVAAGGVVLYTIDNILSKNFQLVYSANLDICEASAFLYGISYALDQRIEYLNCDTDSEGLYNAFTPTGKEDKTLMEVLKSIKRIAKFFKVLNLELSSRYLVNEAHKQANIGLENALR